MANDPKATKVRNIETPYKAIVLRHDPDFEAAKRKEPLYEFSGRTFRGDNSRLGPYSTVPSKRDP